MKKKFGAEKGDQKYMYQPFPYGPAKQACKIGGLPKPTGSYRRPEIPRTCYAGKRRQLPLVNSVGAGRVFTRGFLESSGKNMILPTTHMDKLLPRIERGGGGGCPILAFGITQTKYVEDDAPTTEQLATDEENGDSE